MNAGPESPQDISSRIDQLLALKESTPSALSAAALESRLEEEKAQRKIERFFWLLGVTVLIDCILFKFEGTVLPNAFIILISLVFLIGCARWLEVPWVYVFLVQCFNRFSQTKQSASPSAEVEQ
ncbi:hypothetical protein Acid7E03_15460 [Acidisoma sp. 7E03]